MQLYQLTNKKYIFFLTYHVSFQTKFEVHVDSLEKTKSLQIKGDNWQLILLNQNYVVATKKNITISSID